VPYGTRVRSNRYSPEYVTTVRVVQRCRIPHAAPCANCPAADPYAISTTSSSVPIQCLRARSAANPPREVSRGIGSVAVGVFVADGLPRVQRRTSRCGRRKCHGVEYALAGGTRHAACAVAAGAFSGTSHRRHSPSTTRAGGRGESLKFHGNTSPARRVPKKR